jgi:Methyltransferase domain
LLALDRCRFELGDFLPYLEVTDRRFDLVLASGVLYHSPQPITLLESISRVTDHVALWTHYFDEAVLAEPKFQRVFAPTSEMVRWRGRVIELRRHAYLESLDWSGFCGGSQETTLWMARQSLLEVLAELGFNDVRNLHEDPKHPFGPCILLLASRRQ